MFLRIVIQVKPCLFFEERHDILSEVDKSYCNILPSKHGKLTTCNYFLSSREPIKITTKE